MDEGGGDPCLHKLAIITSILVGNNEESIDSMGILQYMQHYPGWNSVTLSPIYFFYRFNQYNNFIQMSGATCGLTYLLFGCFDTIGIT